MNDPNKHVHIYVYLLTFMKFISHLQEGETLYDMYHTRRSLHKRVYQHRVVKAVDIM